MGVVGVNTLTGTADYLGGAANTVVTDDFGSLTDSLYKDDPPEDVWKKNDTGSVVVFKNMKKFNRKLLCDTHRDAG